MVFTFVDLAGTVVISRRDCLSAVQNIRPDLRRDVINGTIAVTLVY